MLTKYRRPGSDIWHCRGTHLGVSVRRSTKTREASKADAVIGGWRREIEDREIWGKRPTITFAEAALIYLEDGGEGRFLLPIIDHFGERTGCDDIDRAAVERARKALYPDCAETTVRRQLETPIRAVLRIAYEEGRADPPFLRARRRRRKGRGSVDTVRTRWLTPEEVEAMLTAADATIAEADQIIATADRKARVGRMSMARADTARRVAVNTSAMIGFLVGTGCRPTEMLSLEMPFFYPATREAFITETKTAQPRKVRFPARTLDLINRMGTPNDGRLFLTPRRRPYVIRENGGGQIAAAFNKLREAAGLGTDVTPYTLRHTWATWHYATNRDLRALMDLGGWAKPDMAMRYTKLAPDDLGERVAIANWSVGFTRDAASEFRSASLLGNRSIR